MDERNKKPSFEELMVIFDEIKTLTGKSMDASKQITKIAEKMKGKSSGMEDVMEHLSDIQQEIDKINGNKSIQSTVQSMQEEIEGFEEKVNEIEKIHNTIKEISHITHLLALNAAIEMSRYEKEEEARKAFENARKSTVTFKEPTLTEAFASEMNQLTEEMRQIHEKRLVKLREIVLDFIRKTIQACQMDFLETTEEVPIYASFSFGISQKNSRTNDYMDDYVDYEEENGEIEWYIQNFYLYNKEQKWQKSDFYVSYQEEFIRIESLITKYIQNRLLQKDQTILFTVEELKEAFGEEVFQIN